MDRETTSNLYIYINMYISGRSDDLFHPFFVGTKSTNDRLLCLPCRDWDHIFFQNA